MTKLIEILQKQNFDKQQDMKIHSLSFAMFMTFTRHIHQIVDPNDLDMIDRSADNRMFGDHVCAYQFAGGGFDLWLFRELRSDLITAAFIRQYDNEDQILHYQSLEQGKNTINHEALETFIKTLPVGDSDIRPKTLH